MSEEKPDTALKKSLLGGEHDPYLYDVEEKQLLRKRTGNGKQAMRKLLIVCVICLVFMIVELIGGILANSMAIMTDAAHLTSDLFGFLISVFAIWVGRWPCNQNLTFGYHRAEVIGALASVVLIWGLTMWLVIMAVDRLFNPQEINGLIMLITACVGLSYNLFIQFILHAECGFLTGPPEKEEDEEELEEEPASLKYIPPVPQSAAENGKEKGKLAASDPTA